MLRIRPSTAAAWLNNSYHGPAVLPPLFDHPIPDPVQAYLTKSGILIIPGINEPEDRLIALGGAHTKGSVHGWQDYDTGIARALWLDGFSWRAKAVADAIAPFPKPRLVLGHSLGAGIAQMLGLLYNCPTLCFSAPAIAQLQGSQHLIDRGNILNVQMLWDWLPLLLPHRSKPGNTGPQSKLRLFGPQYRIPPASQWPSRHAIYAYYLSTTAHPNNVPLFWPEPGTAGSVSAPAIAP